MSSASPVALCATDPDQPGLGTELANASGGGGGSAGWGLMD